MLFGIAKKRRNGDSAMAHCWTRHALTHACVAGERPQLRAVSRVGSCWGYKI